MPLLDVVVVLVLVGFLLWVVNQIDQIAAPMKKIITLLVIVVAVLWLVGLFVPGANILNLRVGR